MTGRQVGKGGCQKPFAESVKQGDDGMPFTVGTYVDMLPTYYVGWYAGQGKVGRTDNC